MKNIKLRNLMMETLDHKELTNQNKQWRMEKKNMKLKSLMMKKNKRAYNFKHIINFNISHSTYDVNHLLFDKIVLIC